MHKLHKNSTVWNIFILSIILLSNTRVYKVYTDQTILNLQSPNSLDVLRIMKLKQKQSTSTFNALNAVLFIL